MGKSKNRKQRDLMRDIEYKRKQALLNEKLQTEQALIVKDYLKTHSQIDRKNKHYPLTEKVLHGSSEELKAILTCEGCDLKVNPDNYPEGLVISSSTFDELMNLLQ